jgi:hypothetical protein
MGKNLENVSETCRHFGSAKAWCIEGTWYDLVMQRYGANHIDMFRLDNHILVIIWFILLRSWFAPVGSFEMKVVVRMMRWQMFGMGRGLLVWQLQRSGWLREGGWLGVHCALNSIGWRRSIKGLLN